LRRSQILDHATSAQSCHQIGAYLHVFDVIQESCALVQALLGKPGSGDAHRILASQAGGPYLVHLLMPVNPAWAVIDKWIAIEVFNMCKGICVMLRASWLLNLEAPKLFNPLCL